MAVARLGEKDPRLVRLGEALAVARDQAGLTQQEAGTAVGADKQTISSWENGRYPMAVDRLLDLAALYKVDVRELFRPNGNRPIVHEPKDPPVKATTSTQTLATRKAGQGKR